MVTGGCGFIGSNFIRYMINKYPRYKIVNVDKLSYAGNKENLKDIVHKRSQYTFYKADIEGMTAAHIAEKVDAVINFAAESHVDNSIVNPFKFYETNVLGTVNLLQAVKNNNINARYIQISTDEVYGELGAEGYFTEETPIDPSSPYSSSKASADTAVMAFHKTFDLDVNITRCSNNYGPYQYPEKLIPRLITNIMEGKKLPIYGDGLNVRDWVHVLDHCRGIDEVLHHGINGDVYNFGGGNEITNIGIAKKIIDHMGSGETEFVAIV